MVVVGAIATRVAPRGLGAASGGGLFVLPIGLGSTVSRGEGHHSCPVLRIGAAVRPERCGSRVERSEIAERRVSALEPCREGRTMARRGGRDRTPPPVAEPAVCGGARLVERRLTVPLEQLVGGHHHQRPTGRRVTRCRVARTMARRGGRGLPGDGIMRRTPPPVGEMIAWGGARQHHQRVTDQSVTPCRVARTMARRGGRGCPGAFFPAVRDVGLSQVETLRRLNDSARLRSPRPLRLEPCCGLTMQGSGKARRGGRGLPAGRLKNRTPPPVVELATRRGARRVSGGGCGRCLTGLCRDSSPDFGVTYPLSAATCPGWPDPARRGVGASSCTGRAVAA
jgi:hypothetical protein